jgi:RimJ/RimL family protein N-acetyltransferase
VALLPDELIAGALQLRRSRRNFVDEIMDAVTASFDELHRWMVWCQTMPTREAMLTFLIEDESAFDADERWGYSLFECASGELVGSAGLRRTIASDTGALEIGYWVRSDRTRRGYASAAARALVDAGFANISIITKIRISMDATNEASAAVPRKLGFRSLGEVQREIAAEGHSGSSALWEMDRRTHDTQRAAT